MEFIKDIARKYNVSPGLLLSALQTKPDIKYTNQEIVDICIENKVPVLLPEHSAETYTLLVAKSLRGIGIDHIVQKSKFFRIARFSGAAKLWDHYVNHVFDGLEVKRLYINNIRIDFIDALSRNNRLEFTIEAPFPKPADFNRLYDKSIFINGTLYNVTKVSVQKGGLVFLWTTP